MTGRPAPPPLGPTIVRLALVVVLAYGLVAAGAGYWQVVEGPRLARAPDNPAVVTAARSAPRGLIYDRDGRRLAWNARDAAGRSYRVYVDRSVSHPIGYASARYGSAELERALEAELVGAVSDDPLADLVAKFRRSGPRPVDLVTTLSLPLQQAAVRALGSDRGAVVVLDPRTGDVLALASTPTYDASAVANPATADAAFARLRVDPGQALLPRATLGRYTPGSVFKIVTAIAGFGAGVLDAETTFPELPSAVRTGLPVDGFRIREHPGVPARALDFGAATEVSSNVYYALVGLRLGGDRLAAWAARLGFGAPLPFELPTAVSQVTGGSGPDGGFRDAVELASAAYGQGETLVTPLQMALVAACVANGGRLVAPRLVLERVTAEGRRIASPARELGRVLSSADAATITEAMIRAVNGPLGRGFTRGAQVPGVTVAGKSGTAELDVGAPHSWFIGFLPADAPEIAVAVVVERGGSGAERAAPIAGTLFRTYLELRGR
jgi:peptidoglycan glycosyltransferase